MAKVRMGARQCFGLLAPMRTFSYHPPINAAQSAISHLVHFPVIHAHFHQIFTKLTSSYPNSSRPCGLLAPMRTFSYHPPIIAACNIKFSFGTFSLNPPKYSPKCYQNNIFLSKFLAPMRTFSYRLLSPSILPLETHFPHPNPFFNLH